MKITGINGPKYAQTPLQTSFPEIKGKTKDEAIRLMRSLNPDLNLVFLKPGEPFTRDLVSNRVRVVLGEDGKIVNTPSIG